MRTLAFVGQKGGSGKSTLAASIGVAAQEAGERAFLIDLDPQATLASWGSRREAETPPVDRTRAAQLAAVLGALAANGYSLAIIDTQGADIAATSEVMRRADLTLIPSRPTLLDIEAAKPTVAALRQLGRPFAFVLSQAPATASNARADDAARALGQLGDVATPPICSRADHQDALALGVGVTERDPTGKAAREVRELWHWISERLQ
ncbi:MAG TPA: ParA family protein [Pseudolabrys sp.]